MVKYTGIPYHTILHLRYTHSLPYTRYSTLHYALPYTTLTLHYTTLLLTTLPYTTLTTLHYSTLLYSTLLYSTLPYSTLHYPTLLPCTTLHYLTLNYIYITTFALHSLHYPTDHTAIKLYNNFTFPHCKVLRSSTLFTTMQDAYVVWM
jgi:hypothetical protein